MSIAIAELILSGEPWTADALADSFVRAFKRDPRRGYAGSFYNFLYEVEDGTDFLQRIRPNSDKSGAAMRVTPVGLFPNVKEVLAKAKVQAAVTHDTPDGVHAAQAAALATHYLAYRLGPKAEVGQFIESHVPGPWSTEWVGPVGPKGWMSVRAAVTAIAQSGGMSELLRRCVDFTGDVDTVAAIALGAASVSQEVEQDLPEVLYAYLEDGRCGHSYLRELDQKLAEHFPLRA
jgi:ADP-ribosylglycohydrolase